MKIRIASVAALGLGLACSTAAFAAGTSEDTAVGYSGMKPGMSVNNSPADQPDNCAEVKADAVEKGGMKAGPCKLPPSGLSNSEKAPEGTSRDHPEEPPAAASGD